MIEVRCPDPSHESDLDRIDADYVVHDVVPIETKRFNREKGVVEKIRAFCCPDTKRVWWIA